MSVKHHYCIYLNMNDGRGWVLKDLSSRYEQALNEAKWMAKFDGGKVRIMKEPQPTKEIVWESDTCQ